MSHPWKLSLILAGALAVLACGDDDGPSTSGGANTSDVAGVGAAGNRGAAGVGVGVTTGGNTGTAGVGAAGVGTAATGASGVGPIGVAGVGVGPTPPPTPAP